VSSLQKVWLGLQIKAGDRFASFEILKPAKPEK